MIYEPLPFLFFIQVNPCLLLTAYCLLQIPYFPLP